MTSPLVPKEITISPEVMAIARRLEKAGFETWCVGGAVRDSLLDIENNDVDLATAATPKQVRELFRRTVPIGVEHGTVAVLDRHNVAHEVTTFRKDIKTDGRHAEVLFGVELTDDLARRDFTINAIAYHPMRHEWEDPYGGFADLDAGVIRAVGVAAERFREDYLRILRCVRFAVRFGFQIEQKTWKAAKTAAKGLEYLSAERVRDEWFKSLATALSVVQLCDLWDEVGANAWLPGVPLGDAVTRDRASSLDRVGHDDPVFATAYLTHDPKQTLSTLRCSRAEIERGRRIAQGRDEWPDVSDVVSVRRWTAAAGPALEDLVRVSELDERCAGLGNAVDAVRASGAPLSQADLAVDGSDLMRAGVPEGPQIGVILQQLLDTVLEQPDRNNREDLLRLVTGNDGND